MNAPKQDVLFAAIVATGCGGAPVAPNYARDAYNDNLTLTSSGGDQGSPHEGWQSDGSFLACASGQYINQDLLKRDARVEANLAVCGTAEDCNAEVINNYVTGNHDAATACVRLKK